MCCSISFVLLHKTTLTLRFLPSSYILYRHQLMLTLFPEQVDALRKKPQRLVALTNRLLHGAADAHHPHNKLMPAEDVQQLLRIYSQYSLTSSNVEAAHHLLAASCLSSLLRVNFGQLGQNKLYQAVVLHYGQTIEQLMGEIRKEGQGAAFTYSKLIARGIVLSKVVLKLVERTHAFLPEYYRFARTAAETIEALLQSTEVESAPLTERENNEHLVLRMCLSKRVTRQHLLHALNLIHHQVDQAEGICPSTRGLSIATQMRTSFELLRSRLPEDERALLPEDVVDEEEEKKKNDIYLEQPEKVRELTPRIYDEEKAAELSKLRKKKQKLKKKIESDLTKSVRTKQQEAHVLEDIRRERSKRQHKKELFVVEKQTSEARKYHKKEQKVKLIKKSLHAHGKGAKMTQKKNLERLSKSKAKGKKK